MKRYIAIITTFSVFLPTLSLAEEGVFTTTLLSTTQTVAGQPIQVPANPKLQVTRLTILPGTSLPIHKHPYARYAYVEKGEIDVTLVDEKKTLHFKAGDFFVETIGGWHYGTNNGTEPVQLLVIDQMPQDVSSNTIPQH